MFPASSSELRELHNALRANISYHMVGTNWLRFLGFMSSHVHSYNILILILCSLGVGHFSKMYFDICLDHSQVPTKICLVHLRNNNMTGGPNEKSVEPIDQ